MVSLLSNKPAASSSSSSLMPSTTAAAECTTSVHYQLGRCSNCCSAGDKNGYYFGRTASSRKSNKASVMVTNSSRRSRTSAKVLTMTTLILISALFLNAALVEGADNNLMSTALHKFSLNNHSNSSSNSLFGSGGSSSSQNPYTHRFKGLERILSRLDGQRGGEPTGNNEESKNVNSKDPYQISHRQSPHHHQQSPQNQEQRRFLTGGSGNNGHGMSITPAASSSAAGGGGGGGGTSSSGSHQQRGSSPFNTLSSLMGSGGGFHTPGKTYFDAGEDEDLDEELDDDDSYEDLDADNLGEELLNDKRADWAHNYKSRILAQRKAASSTTTTTTTPPPTTTTTTTTTTRPQLTYSQWKWQNLGTRQGLENYRRQLSLGSSSSSSVNSNSIYHSNNGGGSGGGSSSSSYPYNRQGYPTGNNRYHHSSSSNNGNPVPYSPYSGASSRVYPSSSHGNSWTGGSSRAQPQTPGSAQAINEAINHALKVRKEASCSVPQPKVVRVQDFYPHPGKTYVPHCTILHQCSDDTGCCRHDTLTCSPKTTQRVELAFYTVSLDQTRAPMVDRLVFYNHTECECRDKLDEMMPRDQQHTPTASSPASSSSSSSSLLAMTPSLSSPYLDPYSFPSAGNSLSRRNAIIDSNSIDDTAGQCRCPSVFSQRILGDGACSCDCFDKEKQCIRLKRGRDFFSLVDKWCIQSGRCEVPECAYGPYIHLIGRCPRKRERSGQTTSWTRYLTS